MSSSVHNVITRRQFSFTNVAAASTLDVPLVRALDVSDAKSIDVLVRVHALTVSSTASITIRSRAISLSSEEPDVDFTNSTELGTITLDTGTEGSLARRSSKNTTSINDRTDDTRDLAERGRFRSRVCQQRAFIHRTGY